jgi:hypothetical protein
MVKSKKQLTKQRKLSIMKKRIRVLLVIVCMAATFTTYAQERGRCKEVFDRDLNEANGNWDFWTDPITGERLSNESCNNTEVLSDTCVYLDPIEATWWEQFPDGSTVEMGPIHISRCDGDYCE